MNSIKLVIFDLDGTLVDAYQAVAASLNYTLEQIGRAPVADDVIKRSVGWGDRHLISLFVAKDEVDKALSIYRQHHTHALKRGTVFLPGAKNVLNGLKEKGYHLAIASNRPTRFTHIILKYLKAGSMFDYVLCADKIKHPKPAPDILEYIIRKFSLSCQEVLYIGDMTIDAETGNEAGVKTVIVLTGSSTKDEVDALKPYKMIENIQEVDRIIDELSNGQQLSQENVI